MLSVAKLRFFPKINLILFTEKCGWNTEKAEKGYLPGLHPHQPLQCIDSLDAIVVGWGVFVECKDVFGILVVDLLERGQLSSQCVFIPHGSCHLIIGDVVLVHGYKVHFQAVHLSDIHFQTQRTLDESYVSERQKRIFCRSNFQSGVCRLNTGNVSGSPM